MCPPATVSGWRVDVATQAKTVAEMNDPLAVFELSIGDKVRRCSGRHRHLLTVSPTPGDRATAAPAVRAHSERNGTDDYHARPGARRTAIVVANSVGLAFTPCHRLSRRQYEAREPGRRYVLYMRGRGAAPGPVGPGDALKEMEVRGAARPSPPLASVALADAGGSWLSRRAANEKLPVDCGARADAAAPTVAGAPALGCA